VDHACLAIIAFSAGAELQLGDLRRIKKQVIAISLSSDPASPASCPLTCALHARQVAYITLGICLATWLSVFGVLLLMAPYLPMTAALPRAQAVGVISLAATLMMARSPASMVRRMPLPIALILIGVRPSHVAGSPAASAG
jgi:hypothetical protein